jgi:hypothetical protein
MAETIIDGTLLNVNNLMYTAPKATAQGAKSINILNKATKSGLRISTPLMLTWGASDFVDDKGVSNGKYDMSLQFPGEEYKTEDTTAFLQNMIALESKIKSDALIYSKDWFGKQYKSADILEELFSPMLKYPKIKGTKEPDFTKQPTLKIKVPEWEGTWRSEIYDEDGNKLYPSIENPAVTPLDYLKKGTNVACLIQFAGIWIINGKFNASWKLVQAVVQKPRASLQGQCFIKLKPSDKEKLKTQLVTDEDVEPVHISSTVVDDSDEEEEVSAPEPVKVQAPVLATVAAVTAGTEEPKKKKIIKKKVAGEP